MVIKLRFARLKIDNLISSRHLFTFKPFVWTGFFSERESERELQKLEEKKLNRNKRDENMDFLK